MKRNRNDDVIHFLSRNSCYRQNQYINNNRYEENNNDIFNFNNYNTPGLPLPFKHKIYSTRTKEEYLF